jgi:hypothetical protein
LDLINQELEVSNRTTSLTHLQRRLLDCHRKSRTTHQLKVRLANYKELQLVIPSKRGKINRNVLESNQSSEALELEEMVNLHFKYSQKGRMTVKSLSYKTCISRFCTLSTLIWMESELNRLSLELKRPKVTKES